MVGNKSAEGLWETMLWWLYCVIGVESCFVSTSMRLKFSKESKSVLSISLLLLRLNETVQTSTMFRVLTLTRYARQQMI